MAYENRKSIIFKSELCIGCYCAWFRAWIKTTSTPQETPFRGGASSTSPSAAGASAR